MGINISYMGTKKEIAPAVVDVINSASPGIALDVFAGMCSVGEALAPHRTVWTNDVQTFAYEVACALFTDCEYPLDRVQSSDLCFDSYRAQKEKLAAYFPCSLNTEHDLLRCVEFDDFDKVYSTFKSVFATERARPINSPFSLFTQLYPDTYFGLMQAIEVDAIVAAIEGLNDRQGVGDGHRRWLRVCLGRAMLRTANSTGHFAQFLKPKASSFRTFLRQRRRSIWEEWLNSIDDVTPVGTAEWRKGNKSFNCDCLDLIPSFKNKVARPSVIYADPPYTDDQYSRFYHVLETLILYDYPEVSGSGIYRSSRFRTPFSLKSQTVSALHELVSAVSSAGADLVLSYPTNGLIYKAGHDPMEIMKKHFRSVERCYAISHDHSTFGASKGLAKSPVTEQIFLGRV